MKALQIQKYGKQEKLRLNDIAEPMFSDHQILVRVAAASLNPVDYKIRNGSAKLVLHYQLPLTLGHDFSGVVEQVGSQVTEFKVGDKVYGRTPKTGSFQELIVVGEEDIARIPMNLSLVEAAAVPLVALTAYQGLVDWLQVSKDQTVLILGASGGVGHVAVQLARYFGLNVYATVSQAGIDFLESFTTAHYINYKKESFMDVVPEVDAVFDLQGKQELINSFKVVKENGSIASIAAIPTSDYAKKAGMNHFIQLVLRLINSKYGKLAREKNIQYHAFLTQSNQQQLSIISELIEQEALSVKIDKVYSVNEINEAMMILEEGHVKGKCIIDFSDIKSCVLGD